jgi:hypothetical protein
VGAFRTWPWNAERPRPVQVDDDDSLTQMNAKTLYRPPVDAVRSDRDA